jgi:hypothetical protein
MIILKEGVDLIQGPIAAGLCERSSESLVSIKACNLLLSE